MTLVTPPVGVLPNVAHITDDETTTVCGLAIEHVIQWGSPPPRDAARSRLLPGTWYSQRGRHYYGRVCTACVEADAVR